MAMDFVLKSNGAELFSQHMHFLETFAIFVTLAILLTLFLHLHLDYLAFIALGPGGNPSNVVGFMRVKLLSSVALKNPYQSCAEAGQEGRKAGYISTLPARNGDLPVTRGIAPHRQVSQKAGKDMIEKLSAAITAMSMGSDTKIVDISCFEKHGTALFYKEAAKANEICHIHPTDGSMHLVLADQDIKTVLEAGWGERHPLSHGGWFERFVPANFVMVYAPREEAEVEVVLRIVRAAALYVEGTEAS